MKFVMVYYFIGGINNGTSFTFGFGPYSCIGQNFAVLEIEVAIIQLLRNLKFVIDPDHINFTRSFKGTLKHYPPIIIRVIKL